MLKAEIVVKIFVGGIIYLPRIGNSSDQMETFTVDHLHVRGFT